MGMPGKVVRAITDEELERTRMNLRPLSGNGSALRAQRLSAAMDALIGLRLALAWRHACAKRERIREHHECDGGNPSHSTASVVDMNLAAPMDRRTDVEVKQGRIAALLQEVDATACSSCSRITRLADGRRQPHAAFSIRTACPRCTSPPTPAGCFRSNVDSHGFLMRR